MSRILLEIDEMGIFLIKKVQWKRVQLIISQLLFIAIILGVNGKAFAQNNLLFEKANALYNEGNFNKAIETYKQILSTNVHSAELYYNLANAHYKLNQVAPSIYYYEKALLLKPNDKEIQVNASYAQQMNIDVIDPVPVLGFTRWFRNILDICTFDVWAQWSVFMMILGVLSFLFYYFTWKTLHKRLGMIAAFSAFFLSILFFFFAYEKHQWVLKDNPAIVFETEVNVKSEPNLRSEAMFKLHEGTKVQVLENIEDWNKIKIANGTIGWLPESAVKLIKFENE